MCDPTEKVAEALRTTLMEQAAADPVRWANAAGSVDVQLLAQAAIDAHTKALLTEESDQSCE
jgi:hypothetical protein